MRTSCRNSETRRMKLWPARSYFLDGALNHMLRGFECIEISNIGAVNREVRGYLNKRIHQFWAQNIPGVTVMGWQVRPAIACE